MHSSLETTAPATLERRESNLGDKLILKGLKFYGFHGAIAEERTLGQMFLVDIDAWVSLKKAGESDNLEDTISYVDIFSLAKEIVEGSPRNLLETVAELIASKTLEKFHQINAVRVKLSKPNVALIKSTIDYLGVDIFRQRNTSSKN
ncbi:Dihydroneopterin aldolase 1 [Arabidopsis thaliana]|uniref:Dihydroneopterin aldolase 1 n=5 Tax=Arabidopsis TaxID=3701 RepID=FOLB1_ARATH|nr:Dihydroneopterin aldolase [Arabidopsis thaliana]Q9SF23.1 RecName: Full=Dihydroneopterin aldolase 1; Short=DHNA1; AltName: Full=7,8-dihydroneopterin aldolase; AltName: Full=AtFolB1 [Arabidopsis thaliana]1SQL_A Chain A, dihydroneopterin aldolase [Arabidopsis thaliana]1SQL_B Chain B, dihydroneopterin aldolase [Arabidopsis thaliana]1SQL_C Chain C, dihydroneopterin aldolase [Arabidopsis thaliana]1SQL_D Chain D, dihydroneopterin aldolase [Arabidopsis thaliana]1SQL_E Chain E, dihydroneopterin ald|eukprot:NP_187781.1 Dihydroneopterin aldolase [Arabidopsis thaliana]